MDAFENKDGQLILMVMVKAIQENKQYLSEVDGKIGDGDHGVNMNKGFTLFETRIFTRKYGFIEGLAELGMILLGEIGGSMGPIYGTIFMDMAEAGEGTEKIGLQEFAHMLEAGLTGLCEIVDAKVGDKTLVDALSPAVYTLKAEAKMNGNFAEALEKMKTAAAAGRDSTKDMVARFGRASRLGIRSKGVLDAGAVSCCLILQAMADGMLDLLKCP